jgi:hypothetical protein
MAKSPQYRRLPNITYQRKHFLSKHGGLHGRCVHAVASARRYRMLGAGGTRLVVSCPELTPRRFAARCPAPAARRANTRCWTTPCRVASSLGVSWAITPCILGVDWRWRGCLLMLARAEQSARGVGFSRCDETRRNANVTFRCLVIFAQA